MSEQIQQLFKKALQNRNQEEEKAQEEKKKVEELEENNSQQIPEVKEDIKTIEDSKIEEPKVEEDLEDNKEKRIMISIDKLEDFPNQPFKPYSKEKQAEMIESIKINGIIQDLIVRPLPNGKYQILSGHNRRDCAKIVGLTELPCKIKDIEDDDANLILIDSNLIQRKDFFPSEMAKGLLIKKEIYKKRNVKSDFFEEIGKEQNMSRGNIQRYLRLNYLNSKLLEMVDSKEINIKLGEELSFLKDEEQEFLASLIYPNVQKLTTSQVKKLREESSVDNLTEDKIIEILEKKDTEEKENKGEITFSSDELNKYFKDFGTTEEIKEFIIVMLEAYFGNKV
ncbi:MAG: ParB/RepB/Spo0J family partition protein [Clostridia bacterium]|jgi:ParB family chromosome partitioning protein|nr:ParB/RepB/Spo0J family partition protein [Clostridia bacterium]